MKHKCPFLKNYVFCTHIGNTKQLTKKVNCKYSNPFDCPLLSDYTNKLEKPQQRALFKLLSDSTEGLK